MRRAIALGFVLALASGAASAVDFTWVAGATQSFDCALAWSPSYRAPGSPSVALLGSGDAMIKPVGSAGDITLTTPKTIYLGDFTLGAGLWGASGNQVTVYCLDDNTSAGHNGNFTINGTGVLRASGTSYYYIDGDVKIRASGSNYGKGAATLAFQGGTVGTPKTQYVSDNDTSAWSKIVVNAGTTVNILNGSIRASNFVLNGTLAGTGSVVLANDGVNASTAFGPGESWSAGTLDLSYSTYLGSGGTTNQTWTVRLAGGTYPNITTMTGNPGLNGNMNYRTIRMMGDITVAGSFLLDRFAAYGYGGRTNNVLDVDNGSGYISNLHVVGPFTMGAVGASASGNTCTTIYARNARFDLDGDAMFTRYGAVNDHGMSGGLPTASNSTWNFKGNVTFDRTINNTAGTLGYGKPLFMFDNTNLSLATFNVIGAKRENLALTSLLKLGNLNIGSASLTGTLAHFTDNVLLVGNLRVYANNGLNMDCNAGWVNFAGGHGTDATAQTIELDNTAVSLRKVWIKQGSPTWVKLLSDLTVADNLNIDSGCELLLNGHTLTVQGLFPGTYSGSGTWDVRGGGLIVGAAGVPEPATLLLLGSGLLGGIGYIRRKRMVR